MIRIIPLDVKQTTTQYNKRFHVIIGFKERKKKRIGIILVLNDSSNRPKRSNRDIDEHGQGRGRGSLNLSVSCTRGYIMRVATNKREKMAISGDGGGGGGGSGDVRTQARRLSLVFTTSVLLRAVGFSVATGFCPTRFYPPRSFRSVRKVYGRRISRFPVPSTLPGFEFVYLLIFFFF